MLLLSVFALGGAGGQSASGAVKGGRGRVSFRGCEGGNVLSQLWSLVVVASLVVCFCFGGGAGGQSASGAVKGECFESALEFGGGGVAVVVCFCFGGGGAGGQSASGAVKGECFESALELSCSAGNGGESALELSCSAGNGGESALELSCSAGNGGESASGGAKGG